MSNSGNPNTSLSPEEPSGTQGEALSEADADIPEKEPTSETIQLTPLERNVAQYVGEFVGGSPTTQEPNVSESESESGTSGQETTPSPEAEETAEQGAKGSFQEFIIASITEVFNDLGTPAAEVRAQSGQSLAEHVSASTEEAKAFMVKTAVLSALLLGAGVLSTYGEKISQNVGRVAGNSFISHIPGIGTYARWLEGIAVAQAGEEVMAQIFNSIGSRLTGIEDYEPFTNKTSRLIALGLNAATQSGEENNSGWLNMFSNQTSVAIMLQMFRNIPLGIGDTVTAVQAYIDEINLENDEGFIPVILQQALEYLKGSSRAQAAASSASA